ncbi:MAG: hypothetical protein KAH86_09440 [Methanosarcinales archaeon]|nr:hypothetical protein [Methanosarcinales archaeon]
MPLIRRQRNENTGAQEGCGNDVEDRRLQLRIASEIYHSANPIDFNNSLF